MKQAKEKLNSLNNCKPAGSDRDILLFVAELLVDNSSKLSRLIGVVSMGGAIAIALLIALLTRGS